MNQIQIAADIVGGMAKLAAILKVTPQAVAFWRDGKRKLPVEMCSYIERATSGVVTRKGLRPKDWMDIWPELLQEVPEPAAIAEVQAAIKRVEGEAVAAIRHEAGEATAEIKHVPWDGVCERRVAAEPRWAADRQAPSSAAGQGV